MNVALPKGHLQAGVPRRLDGAGYSFAFACDRDYHPRCNVSWVAAKRFKVRAIPQLVHFKVTEPVDPEEIEDDFEGNALLKASVYARHAGGLTISEDSGLIIPALNGLPGPWSARFADCTIDPESRGGTDHRKSGTPRHDMDNVTRRARGWDRIGSIRGGVSFTKS